MTKEDLTTYSSLVLVDESRIGTNFELSKLGQDEYFSGTGRFNLPRTLDEEFEYVLYLNGKDEFIRNTNDYKNIDLRYIDLYNSGKVVTEELKDNSMEYFYNLLRNRRVLYLKTGICDALKALSREYNSTLKEVLAFSRIDSFIFKEEVSLVDDDAFDVLCVLYKEEKQKNPDVKYKHLDEFMSRYMKEEMKLERK